MLRWWAKAHPYQRCPPCGASVVLLQGPWLSTTGACCAPAGAAQISFAPTVSPQSVGSGQQRAAHRPARALRREMWHTPLDSPLDARSEHQRGADVARRGLSAGQVPAGAIAVF
eukprot:scaffold1328_cov394-Prasinococcus_capsulatus_cf.AAC.5